MTSRSNVFVTHPQVASRILSRADGGLLEELTAGSNRRVLWSCESCETTTSHMLYNLTRAGDSPRCGRCSRAPKRSLVATHPLLAAEYHSSRRPLEALSAATHSVVTWKCASCSSLWGATVNARSGPNKTGCPVCAGRLLASAVNSVAALRPDMARDAVAHDSASLLLSSSRRIEWLCSVCGARETQSINTRARRDGSGCLPCNARNTPRDPAESLRVLHPEVAADWGASAMGVGPELYRPNSHALVEWECAAGHVVAEPIASRVKRGACRVCARAQRGSSGEQELADALELLGHPIRRSDRKLIAPYEIDILLPGASLGIEYNGVYWHSDAVIAAAHRGMSAKELHGLKRARARAAGYELLFVWEDDWDTRRDEVLSSLTAFLAGEPASPLLLTLSKG